MGRFVLVGAIDILLHAVAAVGAPPLDLPAPKDGPAKTACVCGDACACKPGACPARCPVRTDERDTHTVYTATDRAGCETMEWTTPDGKLVYTWTCKKGERATEEMAAYLVKSKLCEAGRCPLLPVRVKLVPRKKYD